MTPFLLLSCSLSLSSANALVETDRNDEFTRCVVLGRNLSVPEKVASLLLPLMPQPLETILHSIECSVIEAVPTDGFPSYDATLLRGNGIVTMQNSIRKGDL